MCFAFCIQSLSLLLCMYGGEHVCVICRASGRRTRGRYVHVPQTHLPTETHAPCSHCYSIFVHLSSFSLALNLFVCTSFVSLSLPSLTHTHSLKLTAERRATWDSAYSSSAMRSASTHNLLKHSEIQKFQKKITFDLLLGSQFEVSFVLLRGLIENRYGKDKMKGDSQTGA